MSVNALKKEGAAAAKQRDYTTAVAKYTEATALNPQNFLLQTALSESLFWLGRFDDAVAAAAAATALNATSFKGYWLQAVAMGDRGQGDVAGALLVAEQAAEAGFDKNDKLLNLAAELRSKLEGVASAGVGVRAAVQAAAAAKLAKAEQAFVAARASSAEELQTTADVAAAVATEARAAEQLEAAQEEQAHVELRGDGELLEAAAAGVKSDLLCVGGVCRLPDDDEKEKPEEPAAAAEGGAVAGNKEEGVDSEPDFISSEEEEEEDVSFGRTTSSKVAEQSCARAEMLRTSSMRNKPKVAADRVVDPESDPQNPKLLPAAQARNEPKEKEPEAPGAAAPFKPGDAVRVGKLVLAPKYGWNQFASGKVTHASLGVVKSVNPLCRTAICAFPEQSVWKAEWEELQMDDGSEAAGTAAAAAEAEAAAAAAERASVEAQLAAVQEAWKEHVQLPAVFLTAFRMQPFSNFVYPLQPVLVNSMVGTARIFFGQTKLKPALLAKLKRGIRLSGGAGTELLQEAVVGELARSLGAKMVSLDADVLDAIRQLPAAKGLSTGMLLSSLLASLQSAESQSAILFVRSSAKYIFSSRSATAVLTEELQRPGSQMLCMISSIGNGPALKSSKGANVLSKKASKAAYDLSDEEEQQQVIAAISKHLPADVLVKLNGDSAEFKKLLEEDQSVSAALSAAVEAAAVDDTLPEPQLKAMRKMLDQRHNMAFPPLNEHSRIFPSEEVRRTVLPRLDSKVRHLVDGGMPGSDGGSPERMRFAVEYHRFAQLASLEVGAKTLPRFPGPKGPDGKVTQPSPEQERELVLRDILPKQISSGGPDIREPLKLLWKGVREPGRLTASCAGNGVAAGVMLVLLATIEAYEGKREQEWTCPFPKGCTVKVKDSVAEPIYKWGAAKAGYTGQVKSISIDGKLVSVAWEKDEHGVTLSTSKASSPWKGVCEEMEVVAPPEARAGDGDGGDAARTSSIAKAASAESGGFDRTETALAFAGEEPPPPPQSSSSFSSSSSQALGRTQSTVAPQEEQRTLRQLFERMDIEPPSDVLGLALWNKLIARDVEGRRRLQNVELLQRELATNDLSCAELTVAVDEKSELGSCLCSAELEASQAGDVAIEAVRHAVAQGSIEISADGLCAMTTASLVYALGQKAGMRPTAAGRRREQVKEELEAIASDKYETAIISGVFSPDSVDVGWSDIGGMADTKELLREFTVYPLRFPELYSQGSAAEAPKGVLLFGPPGTGKTMLAKAVATESGASFISIDSTTIGSKWYGESEKYARAVFTLARKLSPCVIFIDEIDSLLSAREDSEKGTIASVKTTIMREWDGLTADSGRVLVIGATNRPYVLDEAILRRMPRRILADLPNEEERAAILAVRLAGTELDADVKLDALAKKLNGYSGSDMRELCREAATSIAHAAARELDAAGATSAGEAAKSLRHLRMSDLETAITKVKPSVAPEGEMCTKNSEWNAIYGEKAGDKPETSRVDAMYM